MEQFLSLVGMQAMKLAVRSGIALTSTYALKQYSTFLKTVDDDQLYIELKTLKDALDRRIKIITPAIDLIELRSGQGNSALESAASLTKSLQREIILLGRQIASLAIFQTNHTATRLILTDIKALIDQIDGSIPLLQLAISASGESLSTQLPDSVSPSRMLQASAFLMIADTQFTTNPQKSVQVGPEFIVSVYMIFKGYLYSNEDENLSHHSSQSPGREKPRQPVWQEVLHKARLRVHRMPNQSIQKQNLDPGIFSKDYSYALEIIEDKDDGRLHDDIGYPRTTNGTDLIPASQVSKLFYTNSAAILNIKSDMEANNTPILLIKRELNCSDSPASSDMSDDETQRRINCQLFEESSQNTQRGHSDARVSAPQCYSHFPSYLDPEWIALEMYAADESDASQTDERESDSSETDYATIVDSCEPNTVTDNVVVQLQTLSLDHVSTVPHQPAGIDDLSTLQPTVVATSDITPGSPFHAVTTSLSLLELVIRLAVLQETQQQSHLSIPDHILTCFLSGGLRSDMANEK